MEGMPSAPIQAATVSSRVVTERLDIFQRLAKKMEPYHKVCNAILFGSVLTCGVISTLSLLILTTSLTTCSPAGVSQVSAITYLLVALGILEAINLLKSILVCCKSYNQCWPTKCQLLWVLASSCISTCSLGTLLFYILPKTDLIHGLALLMSFFLLPMALRTLFLHNFNSDKAYYKPLFAACLALQLLAVGLTTIHDYATPTVESSSHHSTTWSFPTIYSLAILITLFLLPIQWTALYIEGDITIMKKKLNLAAFKYQLQRCHYRLGLVLWIWKVLWLGICLYVFLPSYFTSHQTGTTTCSPVLLQEDLTAQRVNTTREKLKEFLEKDEEQNSKVSPSMPEAQPQWRYFCEIERDPSWIPPQQLESVNMLETESIMNMVNKLSASRDVESPEYQTLKTKVDAIILRGRYSKKSKETYSKLIGYIEGTSVQVLDENSEVKDRVYQVLAIAFVCSNVVALLSAKAACQWQLIRWGYVIPTCMVVPVSLLLAGITCSYLAGLSHLLKCAESWAPSSIILVILCLIWLISQSAFLLHTYHTGGTSLDLAIDFSTPLTSTALVLGLFRVKHSAKSSQVFDSYKFSYIKTSKVSEEMEASSRTESDRN